MQISALPFTYYMTINGSFLILRFLISKMGIHEIPQELYSKDQPRVIKNMPCITVSPLTNVSFPQLCNVSPVHRQDTSNIPSAQSWDLLTLPAAVMADCIFTEQILAKHSSLLHLAGAEAAEAIC